MHQMIASGVIMNLFTRDTENYTSNIKRIYTIDIKLSILSEVSYLL